MHHIFRMPLILLTLMLFDYLLHLLILLETTKSEGKSFDGLIVTGNRRIDKYLARSGSGTQNTSCHIQTSSYHGAASKTDMAIIMEPGERWSQTSCII